MQNITKSILLSVDQYTQELFNIKDKPLNDWLAFSAKYWDGSSSLASNDDSFRKTQRNESVDQLSSDEPKPKQPKITAVIEPKNNKCMYRFGVKSKTPDKLCEKPCSGLFCAQHKDSPQARNNPESKADAPAQSDNNEEVTIKVKPKLKSKTPAKETITDQLVKSRVDTIQFTLNKHGNYEHLDTKLVRQPDSDKIVGTQQDDVVKELTATDIELCKQLGLNFVLPHTLGEVIEKPKANGIEDNTDDYESDDEDED